MSYAWSARGWRGEGGTRFALGDYPWDFTFDFVDQTKELYCHVKAHAKISKVSKPRVKRVQMARTFKKKGNKQRKKKQTKKQTKKIKEKERKRRRKKKKRDKCVVFLFH